MAKVNILTKIVTVESYSYALGGYKGSFLVSAMNNYDASLTSRTLALIPISCCFATNADVCGTASMSVDNLSVRVNGSNAGSYYVAVAQLYT